MPQPRSSLSMSVPSPSRRVPASGVGRLRRRRLAGVLALFPAAFLIAVPDAMASDAWVKPAEDLLTSLTAGLVKIGAPIIGVGIVALGLWAGVSGRIDWSRVAMIAIAGLLVTVGPQIMQGLLGS